MRAINLFVLEQKYFNIPPFTSCRSIPEYTCSLDNILIHNTHTFKPRTTMDCRSQTLYYFNDSVPVLESAYLHSSQRYEMTPQFLRL